MLKMLYLNIRKIESSEAIDGSKNFYAFPDLPDIRKYLKDLKRISLNDISRDFTVLTEI